MLNIRAIEYQISLTIISVQALPNAALRFSIDLRRFEGMIFLDFNAMHFDYIGESHF